MISVLKHNLASVPDYDENIPVSSYSDGSVESYIFDKKWKFSAEESPDDLQINHQIRVEAHLVA
ncbi:hypothetical protein [Shewanella xiamenensis]|uniref:hypothetical protein n=1 Tax=Shewanella xiamenensis TaxID=332186 RepID=UPI00313E6C50